MPCTRIWLLSNMTSLAHWHFMSCAIPLVSLNPTDIHILMIISRRLPYWQLWHLGWSYILHHHLSRFQRLYTMGCFELQVSLPCLQSLFLETGPEKHYLLGIKFSKPEIWLAYGPHELLVKRKLGFKFIQPLCTYELVAQAFMKTSWLLFVSEIWALYPWYIKGTLIWGGYPKSQGGTARRAGWFSGTSFCMCPQFEFLKQHSQHKVRLLLFHVSSKKLTKLYWTGRNQFFFLWFFIF